jgi:hypothetical protein
VNKSKLLIVLWSVLLPVLALPLGSVNAEPETVDIRLYDMRSTFGASVFRKTKFILQMERGGEVYQWKLQSVDPRDTASTLVNPLDFPYQAVFMEPLDPEYLSEIRISRLRLPLRSKISEIKLSFERMGVRDWTHAKALLDRKSILFRPEEIFADFPSEVQIIPPQPLNFREKIQAGVLVATGSVGLAALGGLCEALLTRMGI